MSLWKKIKVRVNKEKMKVSYRVKVRMEMKNWTKQTGMMPNKLRMMINRMKAKKLNKMSKKDRANKMKIWKINNKMMALINKNLNGTHKMLKKSSNNNKNNNLKNQKLIINNLQRPKKSKNLNLKSKQQSEKITNLQEKK